MAWRRKRPKVVILVGRLSLLSNWETTTLQARQGQGDKRMVSNDNEKIESKQNKDGLAWEVRRGKSRFLMAHTWITSDTIYEIENREKVYAQLQIFHIFM